mmetsp:Transcript_46563/g.105219  ORF Transcript_46563/g.105219 Transcript_46563/m.105219 type:complete len:211 (+) Transcript_46563:369-1001(+)
MRSSPPLNSATLFPRPPKRRWLSAAARPASRRPSCWPGAGGTTSRSLTASRRPRTRTTRAYSATRRGSTSSALGLGARRRSSNLAPGTTCSGTAPPWSGGRTGRPAPGPTRATSAYSRTGRTSHKYWPATVSPGCCTGSARRSTRTRSHCATASSAKKWSGPRMGRRRPRSRSALTAATLPPLRPRAGRPQWGRPRTSALRRKRARHRSE